MEDGGGHLLTAKSDKGNVEGHVKAFRTFLCKVVLFLMESPITHCDNVCNMTTIVIQGPLQAERK